MRSEVWVSPCSPLIEVSDIWGGVGQRSRRKPALRFMSRSGFPARSPETGCRRYRISIWMVLKQAWIVHALGRKSRIRVRARRGTASLKSLLAMSSPMQDMEQGSSLIVGIPAPTLGQLRMEELEAALVMEIFRLALLDVDFLLCVETLCNLKLAANWRKA